MGSNDLVRNECEDPVRNEGEVILNCGCEIITESISLLDFTPQFNI